MPNQTKCVPEVDPPVVGGGGTVPVWLTGWALDGWTENKKYKGQFKVRDN